jgi:hypothetical protein
LEQDLPVRALIDDSRSRLAVAGKIKGQWTGPLEWMDGDRCPVSRPDGHVRSQAGPLYYFNRHDPSLLADWGASYLNLRPPEKYPEEWRVPVQNPEEVINDRMAAITKRITTLRLQQEGYDFNCRALNKCEDPQKHEARRLELERLI